MHDIVIVGAGPAGLTAALYAARAGKTALVLEQGGFGGQIALSPKVENYPGIPSASGSEIADTLVEQVLALGVDVEVETVSSIRREPSGFTVVTGDGEHLCKAVILAAGVTHRTLGLAGERDLAGHGVSYCAVCDGAFFVGRDVAVVGGGDTALQDALFLSAVCRRVTLIHRRDKFRGEARLADALRSRDNVEFRLSYVPAALEQNNGELTAVHLTDLKTGQTAPLPVDGLFLAVGQQPHNEPFASLVRLDPAGFVIAGEDCATSAPGVFAAGDCRTKAVRQLTTAVGDGAAAALAACAFIDRG